MTQPQTESEVITLVIEKLTEIVEKQNSNAEKQNTWHSPNSADDSASQPAIHQVAEPDTADHQYMNTAGDDLQGFVISEDIAVVEEVIGNSASSASSSESSPAKGEPFQGSREMLVLPRYRGADARSGDDDDQSVKCEDANTKELESVILNFPVVVGNLNITSTEGLIATLQKLDSALQKGESHEDQKVNCGTAQVQGQTAISGKIPTQLFRCAKCEYFSHNKHYLKQHVELVHTSDRPFKCPFCNYAGKRSHSLKEHLIVHSNCRPYSCGFCNATFRKKGHLTNHIKMHVGQVNLATATTHSELASAGTSSEPQSEQFIFHCSLCSFTSLTVDEIDRHSQQQHRSHDRSAGTQTYGKVATDLTSQLPLDSNLKTEASCLPSTGKVSTHLPHTPQTKEVILVCSECGYKTQNESELKQHMTKHILEDTTRVDDSKTQTIQSKNQSGLTDGKKTGAVQGSPTSGSEADAEDTGYKCAQCEYTTKAAVTFIQHMLSHRPQSQPVIKISTASTSGYQPKITVKQPTVKQENQRIGTLSQPFTHDKAGGVYRCSICGYTCELQRTIKSHIWKHTGHHDIDYPMFRNGPISVYDDYPIGVPLLLSEKAPVTRTTNTEFAASQEVVLVQVPSSSTKQLDPAAETETTAVIEEKATPAITATKQKNKTISQILADTAQHNAINTEAVKTETTEAVKHLVAASSAEEQPSPARSPRPVNSPVGSTLVGDTGILRSSEVSATPAVATDHLLVVTPGSSQQVTAAGNVSRKASVPMIKKTNMGSEATEMKKVLAIGQTLQGSDLLKLIMKNQIRAVPAPTVFQQIHQKMSPVGQESSTVMATSASNDSEVVVLQEKSADAPLSTQCSEVTDTAFKEISRGVPQKRKRQSFDEVELLCLTKKLCHQEQVTDVANVVVEEVSQSYTTPQIQLMESRGGSPRCRSPRAGYSSRGLSPMAGSPHAMNPEMVSFPRVLRGRSRSAEEAHRPPLHETKDQGVQPTTLVSLLKKGPNLNPVFPVLPKQPQGKAGSSKDDDDKPKQGICSSLLAVIEQLRERSRSESEPDEGTVTGSERMKTRMMTRKRGRRSHTNDDGQEGESLEQNSNIERVGEMLRCRLCHYKSAHTATMQVHMLQQHKAKKPSECSLCEFVADSSEQLQEHMLEHCKVRTYQCKLCEAAFIYKSQLRAHMRAHGAAHNPYLCDHCDFQGSRSELREHMLTHDRLYYICSCCEQVFESQAECEEHEAEYCKVKVTGGREGVTCSDCGFRSPNIHSNRKHIFEQHGKKCSQCEFWAMSQADMNTHMLVHERLEVQCDMCSFSASSMRSLKSHMKRHVNDQKFVQQPLEQYKCNLCGYVCHHLPSLKSHMWRHASDTNYSYQDSNDIINAAIDHEPQGHTALEVSTDNPEARSAVKQQDVSGDVSEDSQTMRNMMNNFIRFRCCQCGFESVERSELNVHMKTHSDIIEKTMEVNQGRILPRRALRGRSLHSEEESHSGSELELECADVK